MEIKAQLYDYTEGCEGCVKITLGFDPIWLTVHDAQKLADEINIELMKGEPDV